MKFDIHGNLEPYGIANMTIGKCKKLLVEEFPLSSTRLSNWEQLQAFNSDLMSYLVHPLKQWIDGSFVTNKVNPNDIDVVSFINYLDLNKELEKFDMNLSKGYPKQTYNIDGYVIPDVPDMHPHYDIIKERVEYWRKWFGQDRKGHQKAIVEIVHEAF